MILMTSFRLIARQPELCVTEAKMNLLTIELHLQSIGNSFGQIKENAKCYRESESM